MCGSVVESTISPRPSASGFVSHIGVRGDLLMVGPNVAVRTVPHPDSEGSMTGLRWNIKREGRSSKRAEGSIEGTGELAA